MLPPIWRIRWKGCEILLNMEIVVCNVFGLFLYELRWGLYRGYVGSRSFCVGFWARLEM